MTILWASEKFPPVGRCVYAAPGEKHEAPYTDEHIIPYGLLPKGGDWYLPASSCLACNAVTTKFEDLCLRSTMGIARAKLDLKTRRKKARQEPFDIVYKNPDGSSVTRKVHHRDMPLYCIGFDWAGPGLLRNLPWSTFDFDGKLIVKYPEGELEKAMPADGHGIRLGRIRMLDFARMLAKIAHVYAFAKCGGDAFEPMLLDLVSGRTENAPYFVGGDPTGPPPRQPNILHDIYPISCRVEPSGTHYLLVAIRLFAMMGMPRYHVIVGRQVKEVNLPTK